MRLPRVIICLLILFSACGIMHGHAEPGTGEPFSVMTFNILYDNPADILYSWGKRKEMVCRVIRKHHPANNKVPDCTFIGFPAKIETGKVIGFIFTSPPVQFKLTRRKVIDDQERGYYPSDHLPVLVTVTYLTLQP